MSLHQAWIIPSEFCPEILHPATPSLKWPKHKVSLIAGRDGADKAVLILTFMLRAATKAHLSILDLHQLYLFHHHLAFSFYVSTGTPFTVIKDQPLP